MRHWLLGAALAGVAIQQGALAQVSYPPVDTSTLATPADVQSAIAASAPDTCPVPMPDTLTGSAGVNNRCMPRMDASRPTVIQAKTTLTDVSASWSVTFDAPFASVPVYADARVYGVSQPYLCTVTTLTATGASGKCFQLVATTLPVAATALLGLVVSPFQAAGSGLSVRVVARQ